MEIDILIRDKNGRSFCICQDRMSEKLLAFFQAMRWIFDLQLGSVDFQMVFKSVVVFIATKFISPNLAILLVTADFNFLLILKNLMLNLLGDKQMNKLTFLHVA